MESHVESKQPKKVVIKRQSFLKKVDVATQLTLFGTPGVKLPRWFKNYAWNEKFLYVMTKLFREEPNDFEKNRRVHTLRQRQTYSCRVGRRTSHTRVSRRCSRVRRIR